MAITSGQKNITPSVQMIIHEDEDGCEAVITNNGSYNVMIGNAEVTKNTGYVLVPLGVIPLNLGPKEPVYGVTNQGETSKISYFMTKNE